MDKKIYMVSGLGADKRAFAQLDLSGLDITYIEWITPFDNESIENYASRLLNQVPSPSSILVGLSFGGMMAIEIAKQIQVEKIILIASAKTRNEIPSYYKFAGKRGLNNILPARLLTHPNFMTNWFFGVKSKSDKAILSDILRDTDPVFFKWAISKIVNWKNEIFPENIYHIHGTADRILPIRNIECDYKIKGGGHLMTINRSEEISLVLRKELQ